MTIGISREAYRRETPEVRMHIFVETGAGTTIEVFNGSLQR